MAPIDPQPISARRIMAPEVMVSYSSLDRPQVLQLVERLRSAGVAAWIDQGGIDGARRWGEEIVNAIDACKTVILMISRTAMESENIAKEIALAWENGKKFLPLCLEDAKIPRRNQRGLRSSPKHCFHGLLGLLQLLVSCNRAPRIKRA